MPLGLVGASWLLLLSSRLISIWRARVLLATYLDFSTFAMFVRAFVQQHEILVAMSGKSVDNRIKLALTH